MPPSPALFAIAFWPFASGLMLLWGLAAAIPVAIHLWNRRRYHEVSWAAMEYLLAAVRKNSRRIRIEQLILLAVRISVLLLLALALAEPFWPFGESIAALPGGGGNTHWVLVVDGSYSMDYRREAGSRFESAKALANKLISQSKQGDGFTLVLMSDPPQVVIADPAFDPQDTSKEVEMLALPHAGGDLSATLSTVETILASAREKYRQRLTSHRVCIFTDLGRTTWDEIDSSECKALVGRISANASLALLDLGRDGEENLAVTHLALDQPLVTVGRDVRFDASVQNFSSQPIESHRIELTVDGRVAHVENIAIPALGRTTVGFNHQFDVPGEHALEVRLGSDRLEVDNHRFMSVPVRSSIRALCVEGRQGSARLVAYGLDPFEEGRRRVTWEIVSEATLLETNLDDYDCVLLCNIGRFGRDEAAVLRGFAERGGGVVIFLGDQVQAESYNLHLGDGAGTARLLSAKLGEMSSDGEYYLDALQYQHPIAAPFRGNERSGLFTLPTYRYIRLETYDKATARVALAFNNGDPALVEERIGRGRSILFATAASEVSVDRSVTPPLNWTALPTWRNYPALIQEILPIAVAGRDSVRSWMVGQSIDATVPVELSGLPLSIVSPQTAAQAGGGRGNRVSITAAGEQSHWVYGDTGQSGIYAARFGRPAKATELYAVNVDTRESNLERYDSQLLPSQFQGGLDASNAGPPQLPSTRPAELFRAALAIMLLLLLVETLLAWLFASELYSRLRAKMLGVAS